MSNKLRFFTSTAFSVALALSGFGVSGFASTASALIAPTLTSVEAKNTGGTTAVEEDDSLLFTFSEATNKFDITKDNIDDIFELNNSHTFLSVGGELGDAEWNTAGDKLTVELADDGGVPTVAPGDTVTIAGEDIENSTGDAFIGSVVIGGSFTASDEEEDEDECEVTTSTSDNGNSGRNGDEEDEDNDDDEDEDMDEDEDEDDDCGAPMSCNNALKNGKLYKIGAEPTVYLAVRHCVLKPFRGASVFHARGHKFTDIIMLTAKPAGVVISGEPALPAEGTLVQGDDKTVWFIDHKGKRHGFVSADVFTKLGFRFGQVKKISQSDLDTISSDDNIADDSRHPDGSVVKCGNSAEVFLVIGNTRFPFPNVQVFESRGHSFDHIINVDCGRFAYTPGTVVTEDTE